MKSLLLLFLGSILWSSSFHVLPGSRMMSKQHNKAMIPSRSSISQAGHRPAHRLSSSRLYFTVDDVEKSLESSWATDLPQSLADLISEAQASLAAALEGGAKRLRIDIRTPGLDNQFEQTAIRDKALALAVVGSFFPLFAGKKTKVLFESEGEAALAVKAYGNGAFDIPDSVSFGGLSPRSVDKDDEIIFVIEPANRNGDAVVLDVEQIAAEHEGATIILFNPDLESKGVTGIRERDRRQAFMDSFKSAYIYLCLATLSRPSLIPRELGALHYQYEKGRYRLFRCLLPEDGPGSLNRFLKKRVYESTSTTPTSEQPPRFFMVSDYGQRPAASELSIAMARSEEVLEDMIKSITDAVESEEEARDTLVEAARTRSVDPSKVLKAIAFLEKVYRKGKRKDVEEDVREAEELRKAITGTWRLVFTTGTKGTQAKVGMINYFPLKAQQYFAPDSTFYSNTIYLGDWPVVTVLGNYSTPKKKKLDFVVDAIKLGPFKFGSKGDGFFTMFYVDDKFAVARGLSGGLAFWSKV